MCNIYLLRNIYTHLFFSSHMPFLILIEKKILPLLFLLWNYNPDYHGKILREMNYPKVEISREKGIVLISRETLLREIMSEEGNLFYPSLLQSRFTRGKNLPASSSGHSTPSLPTVPLPPPSLWQTLFLSSGTPCDATSRRPMGWMTRKLTVTHR